MLIIHDDDVRRLTLSVNQNSVDEGNSLTATVSRNDANLSLPLTVRIESTEPSVIAFDQLVTIASGQASATFTILATEDQVDRPNTQVSVSASASGYAAASLSLNVTDNDQPTISIELDQSAYAESDAAPVGSPGRRGPTIATRIVLQRIGLGRRLQSAVVSRSTTILIRCLAVGPAGPIPTPRTQPHRISPISIARLLESVRGNRTLTQ